MKIANISTLKNRLSQYLEYVRRGETVRILDRNIVVAEIIPVERDHEVADIEARGIGRKGTGKIPKSFFSSLPRMPSLGKEAGVLEELLKERKEGR
jgi:antitoxin (DNA-binding transcriptional repressor) of toxin-antitoxin stability system